MLRFVSCHCWISPTRAIVGQLSLLRGREDRTWVMHWAMIGGEDATTTFQDGNDSLAEGLASIRSLEQLRLQPDFHKSLWRYGSQHVIHPWDGIPRSCIRLLATTGRARVILACPRGIESSTTVASLPSTMSDCHPGQRTLLLDRLLPSPENYIPVKRELATNTSCLAWRPADQYDS